MSCVLIRRGERHTERRGPSENTGPQEEADGRVVMDRDWNGAATGQGTPRTPRSTRT